METVPPVRTAEVHALRSAHLGVARLLAQRTLVMPNSEDTSDNFQTSLTPVSELNATNTEAAQPCGQAMRAKL